MRRVISWKRFLIVLAVLLTVGAATYGVHIAQNRRHATSLKDRAEKILAESKADPAKNDEAISLLDQYLKYKPKDEDAFRKFANLNLDRAKADPKQALVATESNEKFLRQFPENSVERRKLIDLYIEMALLKSARQHIQIGGCQPRRALAYDPCLEPHGLAIAEALSQPRQHTLGREVEDRAEVRAQDVGLAFGVVVDVAEGQVFVERQISAGRRRLDAKTRNQVVAADLPDEAHTQLHEREAVALWLGEFC